MAEMVTAIENIEISKFLKLCYIYHYRIPEALLRELNSKENRHKNISVIYADEFNPQWRFANDHLIVQNHFSIEMLNEIKGIRKNAKYSNEEIETIIRLIETLNKGNCREAESRVDIAIRQYEQLKQKVIYAEAPNENRM
jgi:hypothetical protein